MAAHRDETPSRVPSTRQTPSERLRAEPWPAPWRRWSTQAAAGAPAEATRASDTPGPLGETLPDGPDLDQAKKALTTAVVAMLVDGNDPDGPDGAGIGGLSGLLQRFTAAGFGPEAASWVSSATNLPVAAAAVRAAIGDGTVRALARRVGLGEDRTARYLSSLLPKLVDRLTPSGDLPGAGLPVSGMEGAVASLSQIFASHTKIM